MKVLITAPESAKVTSRLGAVGDNKSTELITIPDEGIVFEEQGAFPLLGQAHSHPKTNDPNMTNTPSTSPDDKSTANSISGPIYAVDSYSGKVGSSGRIHRVDPYGVKTNNVGWTIGDGRRRGAGQFNMGKDALIISGKARKK